MWATALYGGLRSGELQALRWHDVDFERGLIRVEQSWDPKVGAIEPKSRSGRRRVPLPKPLRAYLTAHRLRGSGESGSLVFGRFDAVPFHSAGLAKRARSFWARAGLAPLDCTSLATPTRRS